MDPFPNKGQKGFTSGEGGGVFAYCGGYIGGVGGVVMAIGKRE